MLPLSRYERYAPLVFFLSGLALLYEQPATTSWQWLAVSILGLMAALGIGENRVRIEYMTWRLISLCFLTVVFMLSAQGIASPFILWLYLIAAIYGYCFRDKPVAALGATIAGAFAVSGWFANGLTLSSFHPLAILAVGLFAHHLREKIIASIDARDDTFAVLTLRGQGPSSADVLRVWRQELRDYLGDRSIILTTADRQLALLIPDQSLSETEYLADTLRQRFSALNYPPSTIDVGAIKCKKPAAM